MPLPPAAASVGLKLMARLADGVTIEQARARLAVLNRTRVEALAQSMGDTRWREARLDVESGASGYSAVREQFGRPLAALMAVVGLLLLLACTNVASMLLARGAARHRELATRVALGAGRAVLVRQAMAESILLSLAGGLLGILLAYVSAGALVRIIASGRPMMGAAAALDLDVAPNLRVLLFTVSVALGTGMLAGLAPAWSALMFAPASALRDMGGAADARSRRLFGKGLVVAQVAVSVLLLSAAGLFAGHLSTLRNRGLGFDRQSVLLVTLDTARRAYQPEQLSRVNRELLARFEALPGVASATVSAMTPIEGPGGARFATVEGFEEETGARRRLMLNAVGPKYFATLGTPILAGRDFQFEDEGRARVAIVNLAMARHYFGQESAIGGRVLFDGDRTPYEIVGVVGDAKYTELQSSAPRTVYLHAFQGRTPVSQFALRTRVPPAAVAGGVRRAVEEMPEAVTVSRLTTLTEQIDASIVPERLIATLSGLFGVLGTTLAAAGLYGLLAYTVARRRGEIGIRMALGATAGGVVAMVLRAALGLVVAGVAVGASLWLAGRRLAASIVVNLSVADVWPIAFSAAAMAVVALVAAIGPALRAARATPMDALRHD
jgi:predicted permease